MGDVVSRRIVISTRQVRSHAGSSRITLALVRGLTEAGCRVEVVADRMDAVAVRAAGGTVHFPLGSAGLQGLARKLLGRRRLQRLRERAVSRCHADLVIADGDLHRQDVVLVHNLIAREVEALGDAAAPAQHAAAAAQAQALKSNAWRLLVANSALVRDECGRRFDCPADRMAVIHPGYDPRQFAAGARASLRDAVRAEFGVAPGEFLVAFISSGNFRLRGVEVFADTLAGLAPQERRQLRVLGVGHEGNIGLLRTALECRGVDCGLVARPRIDQVERYYHAADLLFHPALFETFGMVCLEAAACGCPVLTSRAVGASEIFDGAAAAAVVDAPCAADFVPVLRRLLTDEPWRRTVTAAQLRAAEAHDRESHAARFLALLRERDLL